MENYLIIDVETANTIDDALTYDIGFAVLDENCNVLESHSYAIADIFLDKELMESAYFAEKIPNYWEDIKNGSRTLRKFKTVKFLIWDIIKEYDIKKVFAHNSRFDYSALNCTQRLLTSSKWRYFFPYGIEIWDTLKMSRKVFGNDENYIRFCKENGFVTSRNVPRYTAEVLTRYLTQNLDFEESHTGLEDVLIEKEILKYCLSVNPFVDGKLF